MSEKSKLLRQEFEEEKTSSKRYGSVSYKYTLIDSVPKTHFTKKQCILVSFALLVAIIAFTVTLILGLPKLREKRNEYFRGVFPVSVAEETVFQRSAVVTDGEVCARIGRDVLSRNGSAVDAAIAMMFCDEIANPQSSGLGGGFFLIFYNKTSRKSEVIDARETAPKSMSPELVKNISLFEQAGMSVGIPGQLKGMVLAHQKFGRLNWSSLVEPSIQLANNGIVVNKYFEKILLESENDIMSEESLKELFVNNKTGKQQLMKSGDIIKRPKLAQTLEKISKNPEDFYNGSIASDLIKDITSLGGIVTIDDFKSYSIKVREPLSVPILEDNYTLLTVPPPAGGAIVANILNIMDAFDMTCSQTRDINDRILSFHRFIESMKFSFAKRSQLGDPDFTDITSIITDLTSRTYADSIPQKILKMSQPIEYYGLKSVKINEENSAHLSVIASNGDTVSVSSTINSVFGSKRISKSTGIVLNNQIKSFTIDSESSANSILGGKRPLSSLSPSIIVDNNGDTKFAIGGIGGARIPAAVSQVLFQTLWKCYSLKESTDTSRLFYDVTTNNVLYEADFPKVYIDGLYHFGHQLEVDDTISSVYSILNTNSSFHTLVDHRKGGSSDGF